jgi:hypothetical protein
MPSENIAELPVVKGRNELGHGNQGILGERSKDYFSGGTRLGLLAR